MSGIGFPFHRVRFTMRTDHISNKTIQNSKVLNIASTRTGSKSSKVFDKHVLTKFLRKPYVTYDCVLQDKRSHPHVVPLQRAESHANTGMGGVRPRETKA